MTEFFKRELVDLSVDSEETRICVEIAGISLVKEPLARPVARQVGPATSSSGVKVDGEVPDGTGHCVGH